VSVGAAKGKPRDYAYYRCIGTDAYRFGGERLCHNRQVRTDLLEAAVWEEVCRLLENPQRLEQEYSRRLQPSQRGKPQQELASLEARLGKLRQGLARLIDGYAEGLIEKDEFEPRLRRQRERITQLGEQMRQLTELTAQQAELRLILGRLEEFAVQVQEGLATADWGTRRELIRTLIKRVEVDEEQVEVVFRVPPDPFESRPERGVWQHCQRGNDAPLRGAILGRVEDGLVHVSRLQPFTEDGLVHRDVGQQPFVADAVEAGFDVAFEYPLRAVASDQHVIALFHCVRARSFRSEPIRVRVGEVLRDGVQGQQVKRLHGSVLHRGDAQGAQLPVRFGDVYSPKWQRLVTVSLQRVYGSPLAPRRGPGDLVHTGRVLAWVLRHPLHGKGLAAERVGQQALQGFHSAPPAFPIRA